MSRFHGKIANGLKDTFTVLLIPDVIDIRKNCHSQAKHPVGFIRNDQKAQAQYSYLIRLECSLLVSLSTLKKSVSPISF